MLHTKLMVVVSRGNNIGYNSKNHHRVHLIGKSAFVWLCKNVRDQTLIPQNVSEKGFSSYMLEIEALDLNWWGYGNKFSQV